MPRAYLGHLPTDDPLHGYLRDAIQPQVNGSSDRATYRVFRLNGSHDVYLYEDKYSGARIVGKFFLPRHGGDAEKAAQHLTREFQNLCLARDDAVELHLVHLPLLVSQWVASDAPWQRLPRARLDQCFSKKLIAWSTSEKP